MQPYIRHFQRAQFSQEVSQMEPADPSQVKNNAGGFVFEISPWQALDRWLILGSEGGTYYCSEKEMVFENANTIKECLLLDPVRTINRIAQVSELGLAPKNSPAIFALALGASHEKVEVRKLALSYVNKVCRIGTHIFEFANAVNSLRGWGTSLRKAIANWYLSKDANSLAYQAVKYQQRNGWSHKDLLRLSHAGLTKHTPEQEAVFRYIISGSLSTEARKITRKNKVSEYSNINYNDFPKILIGYELAKHETNPEKIAQLISEFGLTHEMIPSEAKNHAIVWEALAQKMPMTALVRNLAKMTQVGLLAPLSDITKLVCDKLVNEDLVRAGRIHPIAMLSAYNVYTSGHGAKGSLNWQPVHEISNALQQGFYLSFKSVEPTNKRIVLAIDVSGSMGWSEISGVPGLTPAIGSVAMSMVTARTESRHHIMAFSHELVDAKILATDSLESAISKASKINMGATDCSLPMTWARNKKIGVDAFIIYTDNETWYGHTHPHIALQRYREAMSINAKLIVVGMTATKFSIADPSDAGMLDVVGFSSDAPSVMSNFIKE